MVYVDRIYKGTLKNKLPRRISTITDFFQMRSNLVYMRTCPEMNFVLEGVSKALTLLLVALVIIVSYNYDYDIQTYKVETALAVMLGTGVLHELGELADNKWDMFSHFEVS